jgi:hypothetical protein
MTESIEKLAVQLNEVYELDSFMARRAKAGTRKSATILHKPATAPGIRAFEERTGVDLPGSYKQFLLLHNGWEHFWLNCTLSGVTGKHTQRVAKHVSKTIEWQQETLACRGYETPAEIEAWQKKAKRNLFLKNHLVIGTNFASRFYVYDLRSRRSNGEMSLYYWTIEYGAWETDCTPDFHSFLKRISREAALHLGKLRRRRRA